MALTNAFFGKDVMLSSTVTSLGGITCCCCCCCSKVVSCSCSYSCSCSSRLFSFVLVVVDDSPPPVPEFFVPVFQLLQVRVSPPWIVQYLLFLFLRHHPSSSSSTSSSGSQFLTESKLCSFFHRFLHYPTNLSHS